MTVTPRFICGDWLRFTLLLKMNVEYKELITHYMRGFLIFFILKGEVDFSFSLYFNGKAKKAWRESRRAFSLTQHGQVV